MVNYLQDTWTNGNFNYSGCMKGYEYGQNIKAGNNYKGSSTTYATNGLSLKYGYNQVRTITQAQPVSETPAQNTEGADVQSASTPVFTNTSIHTATVDYLLETGSIKDSNHFASGSRSTFGLGLNGGACWESGESISQPGYTYGGQVYFKQENIWAYGKNANVLGRMKIGAEHQGYHLGNQSAGLTEGSANPDYVSTTRGDFDLSLGVVRYTMFDLEMGANVGYEYNKQRTNGETVTFRGADVGAHLDGTVMFPIKGRGKSNCPVTPGFKFGGSVNYSLKNTLFNTDAALDGNRWKYGAYLGGVLFF